jgi:hypothetical protein
MYGGKSSTRSPGKKNYTLDGETPIIRFGSQEVVPYLVQWEKRKGMVAKRLDMFLISKGLIDNPWFFKSQCGDTNISNHMPIVLEVTKSNPRSPSPYEFQQRMAKGGGL